MSNEFKSWEDYSSEELLKVAKFIEEEAFDNIYLNMNDVFVPAADSEKVSSLDLLPLTSLKEKYGHSGVFAWVFIKRELKEHKRKLSSVIIDEKIFFRAHRYTDDFKSATEEILKNPENYFYFFNDEMR